MIIDHSGLDVTDVEVSRGLRGESGDDLTVLDALQDVSIFLVLLLKVEGAVDGGVNL
jgi:hypothetical protein